MTPCALEHDTASQHLKDKVRPCPGAFEDGPYILLREAVMLDGVGGLLLMPGSTPGPVLMAMAARRRVRQEVNDE